MKSILPVADRQDPSVTHWDAPTYRGMHARFHMAFKRQIIIISNAHENSFSHMEMIISGILPIKMGTGYPIIEKQIINR